MQEKRTKGSEEKEMKVQTNERKTHRGEEDDPGRGKNETRFQRREAVLLG